MTGKERLQAVLAKQPTDRLPWTTLADDHSLALAPPELRGCGGVDFYRRLGCDVFLLRGLRAAMTAPPEGGTEAPATPTPSRKLAGATPTTAYNAGHAESIVELMRR